jgi:hypothetical protein
MAEGFRYHQFLLFMVEETGKHDFFSLWRNLNDRDVDFDNFSLPRLSTSHLSNNNLVCNQYLTGRGKSRPRSVAASVLAM